LFFGSALDIAKLKDYLKTNYGGIEFSIGQFLSVRFEEKSGNFGVVTHLKTKFVIDSHGKTKIAG
jgi:hypothetical protein